MVDTRKRTEDSASKKTTKKTKGKETKGARNKREAWLAEKDREWSSKAAAVRSESDADADSESEADADADADDANEDKDDVSSLESLDPVNAKAIQQNKKKNSVEKAKRAKKRKAADADGPNEDEDDVSSLESLDPVNAEAMKQKKKNAGAKGAKKRLNKIAKSYDVKTKQDRKLTLKVEESVVKGDKVSIDILVRKMNKMENGTKVEEEDYHTTIQALMNKYTAAKRELKGVSQDINEKKKVDLITKQHCDMTTYLGTVVAQNSMKYEIMYPTKFVSELVVITIKSQSL